MAFDEALAQRVRRMLRRRKGIEEKRMFGGVAFMANGNMACGVVNKDLMVRVGPEAYDDALRLRGARKMDFTGRPLRGMVYVGASAIRQDEALKDWVERGLRFARSLPSK